MAPQRPDLVLTADVPDGEADVLVLDGLDVEACNETRALITNKAINDQLRQCCFQRLALLGSHYIITSNSLSGHLILEPGIKKPVLH